LLQDALLLAVLHAWLLDARLVHPRLLHLASATSTTTAATSTSIARAADVALTIDGQSVRPFGECRCGSGDRRNKK
jgi:hypothetical protein